MSNSGEQHNPYAQPQPDPYGQVPAQQNPYAQQGPPQVAPGGGYGYPAPGTAPAGAPDGSGGQGASGWLWATGGAVAASAMWASVMFATGGFGASEPDPDLAGYSYSTDLCADTSMSPFQDADFRTKQPTGSDSKNANPQHSGSRQPSLDSMWCNIALERKDTSSSDYSSTFVYNTATLHKKTDPGPEFADGYHAYEKQETSGDYSYQVEPVSGLGDEAYLVTKSTGRDSGSYVILGVRDGWMTYQSTWSSYAAGSSTGKQPTSQEVATMLKSSATETMRRLR
jgi:hypothetical protein